MNQEVVGTKKVMQGAEGWGSSEDVAVEQRPEGEREGDGLQSGERAYSRKKGQEVQRP